MAHLRAGRQPAERLLGVFGERLADDDHPLTLIERGDDVATSVAFRNLSRAAGGATRVSAYCAPYDELARGRAR